MAEQDDDERRSGEREPTSVDLSISQGGQPDEADQGAPPASDGLPAEEPAAEPAEEPAAEPAEEPASEAGPEQAPEAGSDEPAEQAAEPEGDKLAEQAAEAEGDEPAEQAAGDAEGGDAVPELPPGRSFPLAVLVA